MAPSVEIQMQINFGGLHIVMSQMILDVRYGTSAVEHINGLAVAKRMNRIDVLQPFGRQGLFEILFADAVDAMAGKLLPPLVDKEPVLIWGLRGDAVFSDIELEELAGLGFNLYYPEPVSLSQDRKSFFFEDRSSPDSTLPFR